MALWVNIPIVSPSTGRRAALYTAGLCCLILATIMNERLRALASVLYLRLPDYAKKPVVEQARLRAQLTSALNTAVQPLPSQQRLVLEASDGLLAIVLDSPAAALHIAEQCLAAGRDYGLCVGANHGPVAVANDAEGHAGMVGDGIAAAASTAGFAAPGQLLMTSSFREALEPDAPDRSRQLRAAGVYADSSLRSHELFEPGPVSGSQGWRYLLPSLIGAFVLLGLGYLLRGQLPSLGLLSPPAIVELQVQPAADIYLDGQLIGSTPPLSELKLSAGPHQLELRHGEALPFQTVLDLQAGQRSTLQHRFAPPAIVSFAVNAGAEVFVNGESRGALPALEQLELRAGQYRFELRHPDFPPHVAEVSLEPGQNFVLRHVFAPPAVLSFKVKPAGATVYVDGEVKGNLAEIKQLELPAGRYIIELRHPNYPAAHWTLNLKGGQQAVVKHDFDAVAPAGFMSKFKKALGLSK